MSGDFGLSLYDSSQFKAKGQEILDKCKQIVDNAAAKKDDKIVPIIPPVEDEPNIDVFKSYSRNKLYSKNMYFSSNHASNVYENMQEYRTGAKSSNAMAQDDDLEDAVQYITEQEDDDTNEKMMNLHRSYQKQYGDKYFHGSATTDNVFQYEFNEDTKEYSTNNNLNLIHGTKNSATLLDASFEYAKTEVRRASDSEDPEPTDGNQSANNTRVQADGNEDYPDPDIPVTPPQPKDIQNNRRVDIALLHNREITVNKRQCIVGIGGEYHNHDNGDDSQITLRGGIADAASGFGITFTTTRYESVGQDGQSHVLRDSKVRAIILDNTIDVYPQEAAKTSDNVEEDISDLPIVKTKNKFGFDLVTENKNLGANVSYVVYDVSSLNDNVYNRSQLYLKGGYLNEPQEVDTPDKHRAKLGAVYNYQHIKGNGDYFSTKLDALYSSTMQSGSSPDFLLGISADAEAKIGAHHITFQGTDVKTSNTKFLTLTADYKYSLKNLDFGVSAGYYVSEMYQQKNKYMSANITAAYKF